MSLTIFFLKYKAFIISSLNIDRDFNFFLNKYPEGKMKKFILTLVACLAFTQIHAATSPLAESLLEYQAITNALGAPDQTYIPQTEFIVDVNRITHDVYVLGTVKYKILTRNPSNLEEPTVSCGPCQHHHRLHKYIAELLVEPNPGIGPNIITVISIEHTHN